ncbi:MAG: acyl-CoA dehydrogenase [Acidimicrobiia bacterium]|nr:MAG: acyl-CoA dehydrogenase [Acidimicrobiia bacterium]
MDLDLSPDQVALRDGIDAVLTARFGPERIRAGFDRGVYDELAEAGVFTLRADGFSWSDCVIVFEQLGRRCVPGPLVASLLFQVHGVTGVVERAGPAWVEHPGALDALVVLDGAAAALVDPRALEVEHSPWPLDFLTPVGRVAQLPPGEPLDVDVAGVRRAGAALTAAFQLGLADRVTELAVEYAKERVQFDRAIGSFQAIKHLLADMLVRTEVARAAVYAAGAHLDAPAEGGADRSVAVAKLLAGEAAIANGKAATQVFGGMGYTWEVDVHLFLKRAWVLDTCFGSADAHADAVADALAAPGR